MKNLFLDFETMYSAEYSLRVMSAAEYALDARFEALGAGAIGDGFKFWIDGPDLPAFFDTVDWANTNLITHNALFDAFVLAAQYNRHPARLADTLGMARAWIFHKVGRNDLAALSRFYGLPDKMATVAKTKGVNFVELCSRPHLHEEVKRYGLDDTEKCKFIYERILRDGFPVEQLEVMDMCLKMATQPGMILDTNVLYEHLADIKAHKAELLAKLGMDTRDALMSDPLLAMMLIARGVTPPRKASPSGGEDIYAFAKTDEAFTDLCEHEDPMVQAIVEARLGHKSTIEETRTERFIKISQLEWKHAEFPTAFPVPLKYSGAHTHRFSGDWKMNAQNLRRDGKLRKAIKAPPGMMLVSADASQIEARLLALFARQEDLVQQFRNKEDVYATFASKIYHHAINKKEHPTERQVGKVGVLSLGYGAWWEAYQAMLRVNGVEIDDVLAGDVVRIYRRTMHKIKQLWGDWDNLIPFISSGRLPYTHYGCIELGHQYLTLPNGMRLRYHGLRQESINGKLRWVYNWGNRIKYLWGSKIVENIIQALAFVHIMDVALRVKRQTNGLLMMKHQVHDELIYCVPENIADDVGKLLQYEMSQAPWWMPDAPLAAEYGVGRSYGEIDK